MGVQTSLEISEKLKIFIVKKIRFYSVEILVSIADGFNIPVSALVAIFYLKDV